MVSDKLKSAVRSRRGWLLPMAGWHGYALAVAAVGLAILLRLGLDPLLRDRGPFSTFYPAVAIAVFAARLPGGLLAIILSTWAGDFFFFPPRHQIGVLGAAQAADLAMFVTSAGIMVVFGEALHRARARAQFQQRNSEVNEEKARQIIEAANEGVWLLDQDARITLVNPRLCEMLGYTAEEMLGRRKWDFVFDEDVAAAKALFERRRAGISEQVDLRFRTKDGRPVWTIMAARPLRDANGAFAGGLDMFTDITERKFQQRELERVVAERTARLRDMVVELEIFSYSMAHDLRAPLRAMQGLAKATLEDYAASLPETGQDYLQRIAAAANRMDRLILGVLQYSYLIRGEFSLEPVEPERLLDEIVSGFPNLQASGAVIEVERPLPAVLANAASLSQVFSNLMTNAVKFVTPGTTPRIQIRSETHNSSVRLYFKDNGIGIPLKSQHKIFGIFQRLHPPDMYDGTGIGLAIVKKATERMGGQVGVQSQPGQGSEFWVELKAAEPAITARTEPEPPNAKALAA